MTSSVRRELEAFDFKEEDDLSEIAARKFSAKLENPNSDDNAMTKYDFLAAVAHGNVISKREPESIVSVDIVEIDCDQNCKDDNTDAPLATCGENVTTEDGNSRNFFPEADSSFSSPKEPQAGRTQSDHKLPSPEEPPVKAQLDHRLPGPKESLDGRSLSDCALSDPRCNVEPIVDSSDAEKRMKAFSASSPDSNSGEDDVSLHGCVSESCSSDSELDDRERSIIVTCDYIIYQDEYLTAPLVAFSHSGIKIHTQDEYGTQGTFNIEWKIDDIVCVNCRWFGRVGHALINFSLLTKDAIQGDNISGIAEVKLGLADQDWPYKQEEIKALNAKYMAVWSPSFETDAEMDETASDAPVPYLPNFDDPFDEVIYPKGDPDAVSINKRDVDLLQPQTFLNDNIIDFYAKYLKSQIPPEDRQRFHFFNSFFFRKLADLDRDPSLAADGRAAFMRVRKWTRKINLFEKDYIFIPVNFNLHWSLIVICHPGEVAGFKGDNLDKSPRVPCILHMDSIKGTHAGLKNLIQSYLWEEWRERHTSEDISSKFLNLRFVPLELPQQENSFDCGLFLLHYLELFLAEAPADFNPFKISKYSNFLNVNWFPPLEASLKRTMLQKLIFELLDNRSWEVAPAAERNDNLSSKLPRHVNNETGVELLAEEHGGTVACQENLSNSPVGQGIEITLLGSSSLRNSQCMNESGLVLREFLEDGAPAGPLLNQFQSFEHPTTYYHLNDALSPIEEDPADSEHFMYASNTEFEEMANMAAQTCDASYACGSFGGETSYNLGVSEQGGNKEVNLNLESSNLNSADTEDIQIIQDKPDEEDLSLSRNIETDEVSSLPVNHIPNMADGHNSSRQAEASDHEGQQRSSPLVNCVPYRADGQGCDSSEKVETSVNEGSDCPGGMHPSAGDSVCQDRVEAPNQESDKVKKRLHDDSGIDDVSCGKVLGSSCDISIESQEKQAVKKPRLTPPQEILDI